MNDDRLRRSLNAAVPEPPDASGWADAARRRSRNNTRVRAAGVGVAAVAVIGAMLWPSVSGSDSQVAVPARTPSEPAAYPTSNPDCTAGLTGTPSLPPRAPGEQAVRASLCPRADGPTWTTPADALTTDATALLGKVESLPAERPRTADCSRADDRRYLIVFTMADGSRNVVEGAVPNACEATKSNANGRRWQGMYDAVFQSWTGQRQTPPQPGAAARCRPFDRPGLIPPEPAGMTAGALCVTDPSTGVVRDWLGLAPDVLAHLKADFSRNWTHAQNVDSRRDGTVLTLADPWGDPLVLWRVEGNQWFAFMPDPEGSQLYWQPGPEAQKTLQALVDRLKATPSATATSVPAIPASDECRGLTPSAGPVPTGAARLRLCPAGSYASQIFTPLDTVDGERAASVLRVLNAQAPLPPMGGCNADYGADFQLVAESDGIPPVVMVLQLYGCRVAGTADDQRETAADAVLDEFKSQLTAQRDLGPRAVLERVGPLCGAFAENAMSVMPVEPADASGATFCGYAATDHATARETKLSGDEERRIMADVVANSWPAPVASCPNWPRRQAVSRIALTTMQGDVLLLTQTCIGGYAFIDGSQQWQWTPSKDVARLVAQLAKG